MKVIIIDDEQLARDLVKTYINDYPFIEIIAECSDGFQGLKAIQDLNPDLVFLDVQMPKLTGFEMLELLENPPIIIFTTAYSEFALKAFEKNAVDYLLKPFSKERFQKAIEKAQEKTDTKENDPAKLKELFSTIATSEKTERIVVKTGTKIQVIPLSELLYLEAQDDYVMLYTSEGKFLKQQTMKHYESTLDPTVFIRVHRSYIVNIKEVIKIEPYEKDSHQIILKNSLKIPVSRSGYSLLKKILEF
jgi:two-component system LytT family response regulator